MLEGLLNDAQHSLNAGEPIDWDSFALFSWEEYHRVLHLLHGDVLDPDQLGILRWAMVRLDLYYALTEVLSTKHFVTGGEDKTGIIHQDWLFDRCREVQKKRDKVVDIWSRFHWKSNIKTFAMPLVEALRDPNITMVIFSHTRPMAKKFLAQIQREIEINVDLQSLSQDPATGNLTFPHNKKELVRNSLDHGIIVPRSNNPREGTFEAFGYDSLPTGGHWQIRLHDDASVRETVTTGEQIEKSISAWELTQPLGMPTGRSEEWMQGTLYAHDDLYTVVWSRGYDFRIHPCYRIKQDETFWKDRGFPKRLVLDDEDPVLYKKDKIRHFLELMGDNEEGGSANAALQMRCDPNAGESRGFSEDWLRWYDDDDPQVPYFSLMTTLCMVDAANERSKGSDYTCFWVASLGWNGVIYIRHIVRDRLNLVQRGNAMFRIARTFHPVQTRYERYGIMVDTQYLIERQKTEGHRFQIIEVGGNMSKRDRIERLIPFFEAGRIRLPKTMPYTTVDGVETDLIADFLDAEYLSYPNGRFLDMLDALSRLCDIEGYLAGSYRKAKIPLRLDFQRGDLPDGVQPEEISEADYIAYYEIGNRSRRRMRRHRSRSWMGA